MFLLELSQIANYVLSPDTYIAIALVFILIASMHGKYIYVFEVIIVSILGTYGVLFVKYLVGRERPIDAMFQLADPSFPSGHATTSAIFFFMVAYYLSKIIKNRIYREIIFFTASFFALFGGLARVVLKVHYITDVIAGFAFGILICLFSILIAEHLSFHGKRLFNTKKKKNSRRNVAKTTVSKA